MKRNVLLALAAFVLHYSVLAQLPTPQALPFSQDWTNIALITTNNTWSGVPGILGFNGAGLTGATGTDPQTITADNNPGTLNVLANQTNPAITNGGLAEFELVNPVVALQGSNTANAPYLLIGLNTTGFTNITVSYSLRDIDGTADNAIQSVALQYRVGASGIYTNIPAAFVSDASSGPSLATLVTPVSVTLPVAAENQTQVYLRIMTTNAVGSDEWIGVDDISVTGTAACPAISATISGAGTFCTSGNTDNGSPDLSVSITGGTGPYTVVYTDGMMNFMVPNYNSGATISQALSSNKTFTLVSVTDANNCTAATLSGSAIFAVSTPISATISGAGGFCVDGNTLDADMPLIVTITGGTGPYVIDYTDGLMTNYPSISNYVSGTPISQVLLFTTTYTLVSVTDANSCPAATLSGSATFFVSQDLPEVVSSTTDDPSCDNDDGVINITSTSGGMGPYTYTWSTVDGGGIVQGNANQTALSAGTYTLVITDANGCENEEPISFTLNPAADCNCDITSVSFQNVSACNDNGTNDPSDDFFIADVVVNFVAPPATGFLQIEPGGDAVNVHSIAVGSLVGNSHTFTSVIFGADGMQKLVEVEFTALPTTCVRSATTPGVLSCSPVCDIISATFQNVSACNNNNTADPLDDFYTADIVVNFVNPPQNLVNPPLSGFLQIEPGGDAIGVYSIAVGSLVGNTHTFTGVQLKADGLQTVVEVEFTVPANLCVETITRPGVPSCTFTCPTFGGGSNPVFVCAGGDFSLSVTQLSNMAQADNGEANFGIDFVVFPSPTATPYTGGTLLGSVPFANLGGGGTSATLNITNTTLAVGNYVAYAILSPTPASSQCRPSQSYSFEVVPGVMIFDVTGGGSTCENGGSGVSIGLSGSQAGYSYRLILNGTPPPITTLIGTGMALNFGNFNTPGTYTVTVSDNTGASCTGTMNGSAVIGTLPESPVPTVTTPVVYCQGDMAAPLTAGGVNLLWYESLADVTGDPVAPTPSTAMVGNTSYFVSQTTSGAAPVSVLAPGDLAIIGWVDNVVTGGPDVFAFVPFVNLAPGTVIYFTENGWDATLNAGMGGFRNVTAITGGGTEGFVRYTAPVGGVTAGTVIYSNSTDFTSSGAIPPGGNGNFLGFDLSTGGDQIYAFQNSNPNNPMFNIATITHLFVLDDTNVFENGTTTGTGNIPPGLTAGVTANTFSFSAANRISLNNDGMARTPGAWLTYIGINTNYTQTTGAIGALTLNIPNLNVTLGGSSLCESDRAEIVVTVQAPATAMIPAVSPVCINTSINLSVTLGGSATGGAWTANVMGGSFAPNNTSVNVTYTPPLNFSGNIIFTFTTNDPAGPCPAVMTTRTVEVQTGGVNAGPDQIICAGEMVSLNATLGSGATTPVSWSASVMGGSFAPADNIVSVYTPPVGFSGNITLTLTATGNDGICDVPQDELVVTVLPAPPPPTVTTPVVYCQNAVAVPLTAMGTDLLWYDSPGDLTGDPVAPTPSTAVVGDISYYVTQTLNTAPPVSVLAPGDLAIIALKDGTDDFAFVPFVNLAAGTVIYFTDNGWEGTQFRGASATNAEGNEDLMQYVAPSTILAGTVITMLNPENPTMLSPGFTAFGTPIPGASSMTQQFRLLDFNAGNGDQIYAFQNSNPNNPLFNTATLTHLFVFDDTDGFEVPVGPSPPEPPLASQGDIPPGLTLGLTAVTFNFIANNTSQLNNDGARRTPAEWLAYIANPANYAGAMGNVVIDIDDLNLTDVCESPRAEIVVTIEPTPGIFTVTGGGDICDEDPIGGLPVGLSDSETGVNYQLQFNNVNVGAPVPGTGNAISFGNQPPGVGNYTVMATVVATGCSITMNGSAQVTAINCRIEITDPCICLNNATNLTNGQFGEEITVFAITGQVWTLIANTGLYQPNGPTPPGAPVLIPLGTVLVESPAGSGQYVLNGVHVDDIGYTITVRNDRGQEFTIGNSCAYPNPVILSDLTGPFCLFSEPVQLLGDPGDDNVVSAGFFINGVPATVFDPAALGVGTYVIKYIVNGGVPDPANDDPGCIYTITVFVQVVATPANLSCNDLVTVSLDADCSTELTPDMVLEGSYGCFDDYIVEIDRTLPLGNGPWQLGVVGAADINGTFAVRVRHLVSGNSCWGNLKVEDKIPPVVICEDFDLPCNVPNITPDYLFLNGLATLTQAFPVITDCDDFTSVYKDVVTEQACATGFTKIISRTWTATDASGNKAACTQTIRFIRPTLADVDLPESYDGNSAPYFSCGADYPSPEWINAAGLEGTPTVFDQAEGCNIGWTYTDERIDVCDGTYKILRRWTIVDWCPNTVLHHIQTIKVVDDVKPILACPANLTVSTDPFNCCATVDLPDIFVEDACSRINNVQAMVTTFDPDNLQQIAVYTVPGTLTTFNNNNIWDRDTLARFGVVQSCLPLGTHTVMYSAEDDCGNVANCMFQLVVADLVPPEVSCVTVTQVGLTADSMAIIPAISLNSGTYDNCSPVAFKARRVNFNECQDNIFYHDSLTFCCSDIGTIVMVELRAWDIVLPAGDVAPNFQDARANSCMVSVLVEDKVKPTCVPPAHVTVSCENFDPTLWAYGFATSVDNCCLDTITATKNLTQFDTTCNRGTIVRTFRVSDCSGNTSSCTQRIQVTYGQNYFLKLPDDKVVYSCNGAPNAFGTPTFFGEDCELLGVSYNDVYFTLVPDACYKIERTWTIINWCTYLPDEPCIEVPNPNPSFISNDPANIRAPILSPINTPVPWAPTIIKINPTDPLPTNFSDIWDPNANCYRYKQIIKVLDIQDPVFAECPAGPVDFCDYTANDSLLWNFDYWWDNTLQTHDLCEGPADLKVTALDSCSGTDIRFRFLLFLDLDGDGEMESVVSSTNPPAPGTIHYNNINTLNYQGGEIRQFQANVPPNQRSRFTILENYTPDGTQLVANLRFNTVQLPNVYTIPQLPHGRHKIKWIVEDKCGNETICEYEFVVRDCKAPVVACADVNINLMFGGMATLWANDFFLYGEDNCTPNAILNQSLAVIRADENPGETYPGGSPQNQSVVVTCLDEGQNVPVQIWLQDAAQPGNADFCIAYINVQANVVGCEGFSPSAAVAGALTMEGQGVEQASVELQGAPNVNMVHTTNDNGAYHFASIPLGANVTVTPTKDDNPLNGVSTYDLVLITKHILGLEPLTTPYKMIAADANRSGSITSFDIVEFRKLILGVYNELPNNTSWRFVEKAYTFPNPANPFGTPFPENISLSDLTANMMTNHFEGVKIGDVNGTAIANSLQSVEDRTAATMLFDVQDRTVKAGEVFTVNFKGAERVQGYQFTMNFNGLEVQDITPGENMKLDNFGVFADAITTSVDGEANEFAVTFRATKAGQISNMLGVSSRITKAEGYSLTNDRLDVAFRFNGAAGSVISGVGFELYQNQPNPFVNKTFIGFHLPEATQATLRVFDEAGRMVFTQQGDFAKGYNTFAIDRQLITTTGVLYYTLETATDSATKKMIQSK